MFVGTIVRWFSSFNNNRYNYGGFGGSGGGGGKYINAAACTGCAISTITGCIGSYTWPVRNRTFLSRLLLY